MIKFLFSRYLTYVLIFIEILIAPRFFMPNDYGQYEYYKYIIGFASFALLGSHTGYIYYKYSKSIDLFESLLYTSFFILFLVALFIAFAINNFIIVIPFVIMGLSAIIEKKLQVSKNNFLAILFKPLISLFLVILILLNFYFFKNNLSIIYIISISFSLALFLWVLLIFKFNIQAKFNYKYIFNNFSQNLSNYFLLIKCGFIESLATVILGLFLFVDRYYFKNFDNNVLPTYSLAFNFSQFVFVGINSIALILNIEISEKINNLRNSDLTKILNKLIKYLIIFILGVFIVTLFYTSYVKNYDNLIIYSVILSFFIGIFYALNIFGTILLLKDKQYVLTLVLLISLILNILLSILFDFYNLLPIYFLLKTGLIISFTGIYIYIYAAWLIRLKNE